MVGTTVAGRRRLLAFALVVALAATVLVAAGPARSAAAAPPAGWEQDMLNQVNQARAQAGRPPLSLCATLNEAAQQQTEWIAAIDTLTHDGEGGSQPWHRAEARGYVGWTNSGENVAYTWGSGYDVAYVMSLWMASPGHRDNIENPNFTHLGVGAVYSASDNNVYWTQAFGRNGSCSPVNPRPPREPDPRFVDVQLDHPFRADILWLVDEGVTAGRPDGTFGGGLPVSRQSMAAFLHRYAGEPPTTCDAGAFPDVGADNQFCAAITWLVDAGITGGFSDGTFRPTASVSRQSMAAFLHRFVGQPPTTCDAGAFSDVGAGNSFCAAITWLVDAGITTGFPDGTFRPTAPVSRQSMAAFLHRLDALPT